MRDVLRDLSRTAIQCALLIMFLPYRAWLMIDAVCRTLFRLYGSHRHLLEWETADAAERRLGTDRWCSLRELGWTSVLSVAVLILLPAPAVPAALPILIAWFVAPAVAHWISRPLTFAPPALSLDDQRFLRVVARKTWAFFEEFVTEDDHWLPPDNFQEYPREKLARRVSPTNTGLYIVSALTARDFGYCGINSLVELLERNLATLERLQRHRGHFLNWYDTETLEPLAPRYASTADSGNLAACLIAAARGVRDICQVPLLTGQLTNGLCDAVAMVEHSLQQFQPRGARFGGESLTALENCLTDLCERGRTVPSDLEGWRQLIARLAAGADELVWKFEQFRSSIGIRIEDLPKKVHLLSSQINSILHDVETLLPWLHPTAAEPIAALCRSATPAAAARSAASPTAPAVGDSTACAARDRLWHELSGAMSVSKLASFEEWGAPILQSLRESAAVGNDSSPGSIEPGSIEQGSTQPGQALIEVLQNSVREAAALQERLELLGRRYLALAQEMDFTLTYNPQR
ncbi:MAG TPA: hypothetical protein VGH74_10355, partial [Planctomycetaceae bacterium]